MRFRIAINHNNDVHVVDSNGGHDLVTSLNHPMSLNKIKSFVSTCNEEEDSEYQPNYLLTNSDF